MGERRRLPARVPGHQAVEQGEAGPRDRGDDRGDGRSGVALRRADQADPRVQATVAAGHAHRPRLSPPRRGRHSAGRAEDVHLRGKGGAGVLGRQADHQIDLQRRLGDQPRSAGEGPAPGRLPSRLSRVAGGKDHPRRRSERADLDRRNGGLRDRQHEARHERRADDRDARRRQRRDPGRGGRGEHLHLRPDRGRDPGAARRRALPPTRPLRAEPLRETDHRCVRLRPVLSGGAGTVSLDHPGHPGPRRRLLPSRRPARVHRDARPSGRRIQITRRRGRPRRS